MAQAKEGALRYRVQMAKNNSRDKDTPQVSIGMESSFPGILRMGTEPSEPHSIAVASYPSFQPQIQSYLWVSTHPQLCVNRIRSSTAFKRKSKATLKRLAFSKCLSIRYAAEMEILLRELVEHHFPCQE